MNCYIIVALLFISQLSDAQSIVQLFNQNNLDGWYAYDQDSIKYTNATDLFSIENKVLRLYGAKAAYLMSKQSFKNFKLTVEYRWNIDTTFTRKSNKKNSGVMYLVPSDMPDMLWPKGIQFQIKEGATGDIILLQGLTLEINGKRTEPGRSVVAPRFEDATMSLGEWNVLVIKSLNGVISQKLNGKIVNKGSEPSVNEGRILLQYEGFPIDFRKVEIEKL